MKTTASDHKVLLTKKGMKELRKEISRLIHEKQKTLQSLREGDKDFNRDGRLRHIEQVSIIENLDDQIEEKKMLLNNAKLAPAKKSNLSVAIGSAVELIDQYGQRIRFKIVNTVEANPSDGRISDLSPLGKNLLGKTVRDVIEWQRGNAVYQLRLVRIY